MANSPLNLSELSYHIEAESVTPDYFVMHYMEFLPRYIAKGNPSEDTLRDYSCQIDIFIKWCVENKWHPLALNDYQMRIYRDTLMQKNYKSETISGKIIAVRAFYNTALKLNLIKENPCTDIDTPLSIVNDSLFHFFTLDQMADICSIFANEKDEFIKNRNTLILYLMGVEGLRNVEVHRACLEDINWDARAILIRGKGRKGTAEAIYPCEETFELLEKYLASRPLDKPIQKDGMLTPLILSYSNNNAGGRISRNGLRYIMNMALKKAGLKQQGISCHVFRHSCGTNLYQNTKDLRVVQETLRQKDPKITARYAHVHERITNRVTSALSLRSNSNNNEKEN